MNPLLVASNLIMNWLTMNKVEQVQASLQSFQPVNMVRANPVLVLLVPPLQDIEVSHWIGTLVAPQVHKKTIPADLDQQRLLHQLKLPVHVDQDSLLHQEQ